MKPRRIDFRLRLTPELGKAVRKAARKSGLSLNTWISLACSKKLAGWGPGDEEFLEIFPPAMTRRAFETAKERFSNLK